MEEGCQGWGWEGGGKKEIRNGLGLIWVFFSRQNHTSDLPIQCHSTNLRSKKLQKFSLNLIFFSFIYHYNCILFMVCSWLVVPPHLWFPLFFCPSLTLPHGLSEWVGSSLSVCWWLYLKQWWCSAAVASQHHSTLHISFPASRCLSFFINCN